MQAAATPGIMQLVVLFQALSGMSGGQAPIGMPPLPEKAIVSRVAPEECVLYMSMSGQADPDTASTNKTELLLAQPEMQALFASIDSMIGGAIEKNAPSPDEAQNAKHAYDLGKAFLTHPWCAYLSEIKIAPVGPPDVKGGVLLYLGDDTDDFKSHLEALMAKAKPGEITTVTVGDSEFSQAVSEDGFVFTWGFQKGIFVAGFGEGSLKAMCERIATPAPAWLVEMKKQLPVERPAMVTYLNLDILREQLLAVAAAADPAQGEQAAKIVAALGLDKLKAFKAISGMDKTGMVEKTLIESDGPLSGPLSVLFAAKLEKADLNVIPDNAVTAFAVKFNVGELFKSICETADEVQPGTNDMIQKQAGMAAMMTGFQSLDELLATIGETWTFSNSSADQSNPTAGIVITVEVKEAFSNVPKALEAMLMMGPKGEGAPKLTKIQVADTEVSSLQMQNLPPNVQPCWCIKDGRLIVALSQKGMEAALSPASSSSRVAAVPAIAEALDGATPPMIVVYSDTKKSIETIYPTLPVLLMGASTMTAQSGIDLSSLKLPQLSTLLPYAEPTTVTVSNTPLGIQVEQRATMPGFSSSVAVPAAVILIRPAAEAGMGSPGPMIPPAAAPSDAVPSNNTEETGSESRGSGPSGPQRAASINNMKQIVLCMHNYHAAKTAFPPAYTTDAAGKPLLSWRVYMLPYLEEQELFEEFHLDEPWDSPHNKKLIPRMPATFRSPNYAGEPGKTNYLTIRTPDSAFPGKEKIGLRDIKDGTSNTIMLVEVNNDSAVIWTKPDDYVPDPTNPLKGLIGLHPKTFNVGFCDGSVRSVAADIDLNLFKGLVTRAGGENVSKFHQAP